MMKTVLSALITLGMGFSAIGQSLTIESYSQTVNLNSRIIDDHSGYVAVKNVSGATVNVWVKRIIFGTSSTWCAFDSAYFCWDLCYGNNVNASIGGLPVGAGQTSNAFTGHVYSTGSNVNCVDSIRYTFYNETNPNDSVSVVMRYQATSAFSIAEKEMPIAKMYPNPASNFVFVELATASAQGTTIELFNLLGAKVRTVKVTGTRTEIPVGDLHNGIYLCTINKNGKALETRKITVRH